MSRAGVTGPAEPWQAEIAAVFGADVAAAEPVEGGDLSGVLRVTLRDGRRLAVKRGAFVGSEARMLEAMRLAGAPVPEVLHQGGSLLCLDWLEACPPTPALWRDFGAALRRLHRVEGAAFGWTEDYAFGPVALDNRHRESWPSFWAEARLAPFLPHLDGDLARRVEAVIATLDDRLPAAPRRSLLHGDLWLGNLLFSDRGAQFIDPACYHGDAEVDLAMLDLFGPPDAGLWAAYGTAARDRSERRPIYQLFPALVHLRLFGNAYRAMVERCLDACRN